ncbi:LysR family transcriptional regulator [Paenibacillus sp. QZ-Y1]|uniref:LysR family transcriptional regulator n=1 Tax=Paenibacillus sp. QZ-Y1 TaxID=3414511 RepID=UPI003F7AA3AC
MDIAHLKYFQTVARTEHMTKAAHELHMAQPALSMIISRLEDEVGVPLFDRVGRKIRLNAYGKAYLKRVNQSLTNLEEGRREVMELAGYEQGKISLATTTLNRLTKLLSAYLTRYPDVNFKITQASTVKEKLQLLEQSEIDFFLTSQCIDRADIKHIPLVTEEILLTVPSMHPLAGRDRISLTELANEDFISLKQGYSFREITDMYCRHAGFLPHIICEGDEPAAIAGLVQAGLGIAFAPAASQREDDTLSYLHIDGADCQLTFYLAWVEGRYLSRTAQNFRDYVIAYFAALGSV